MGNFLMIALDAEMLSRCHCKCWRIDWRKLILAACVATTVGALLQLSVISDPSTIWFRFRPVMVSSYKTLNSTVRVGESLPLEARFDQFPPASTASFSSDNSTMSPALVSGLEEQEIAGVISKKIPAPEGGSAETLSEDRFSDPKTMSQPPGNVSSGSNPVQEGGGTDTFNNDRDPKVMAQPVGNISLESDHANERGGTVNLKNDEVMAQPVENILSENNHADEGSVPENLNNNRDMTRPVGNIPSKSNHANKGGGSETLINNKDPKVMSQPVGNVPPEGNHTQHGVGTKNYDNKRNPKTIAKLPGNVSATGKSFRSSRPVKSIWTMSPDQALVYAKREIENAPVITEDPDLHAPIFRNISVFKRSYELMEKILKVYIYKDGARPIFHTPNLRGIYASEGWFMKLMEENRQFVVNDPNKAHLFYLPYSARQLELSLYVPNSHNMRPLSVFLKEYVNMLAAKYPFWNRTRGSDHFLVACHDWGPYTTTLHDELCKNTIKALCNADVSEGIFISGKDVSLPETTIRNPKKPLRDLGGKPISLRPILAFFAGNMHGRVRPTLLKYWDGKDEDMKIYGPLPVRVSRKMSYIQHMKSSKFCICPMGYEVNSPRIVEAIYYECVPVIIADNFVPPLYEVLNWAEFSVTVAEKDIPNLKEILLKISLRRYIKMHTNIKRLQKHFLWHTKPIKYDMFHMILHSIWFNRLNHIQIEQQ